MITVEKILREEVARQRTPSVQHMFFNEEVVIYKFQDGLADIRDRKKVNDATTYHAFSVTKTFTALAILQLAEQGKLNIDKPVNAYLPEFTYDSEITVKQLLTHSAGIPNPMPLNWIRLASEHESFNRNYFFEQILNNHNKVKSKPNEKFAYSNLGYVILGQLIEEISGLSYEQYVQENILKRLNLQPEEMGFTIPAPNHHATGYHKKMSFSYFVLGFLIDKPKYMGETHGKWRAFNNFYINGTSYGGLIGTPNALVKYVQELLRSESKLLSDDSKKIMFSENIARSGKATGMCLSWFKGKLNNKEYFAHAGGGGGYYCEIRIYPEIGFGSVIMFNRTGMADERFLDKVDKFFLDKY